MEIAYESTYLPNGLCVLAHRDSSLKTARVFLGYKVGSCHEQPGSTGVAHLLEHLMFEGTPRYPHFDTLIQKAGGASNAFTSQDFTCYYESLPDENLEVALTLEADRMLNAALTDEKIEIQKKVVLEEF
jgi:predicted Zn-dependent peptidase